MTAVFVLFCAALAVGGYFVVRGVLRARSAREEIDRRNTANAEAHRGNYYPPSDGGTDKGTDPHNPKNR